MLVVITMAGKTIKAREGKRRESKKGVNAHQPGQVNNTPHDTEGKR